MKFRALLVVLALVIAGCGASASTSEPKKEVKTTAAKKAPKAQFDKKAYAVQLEKAYVEGNGQPIRSSCDASSPTWQCYYDGIEANAASLIHINLTTPGDITKDRAKEFSKRARLAWFNFVGADFKKLDTIVTMVNGRDTGTTYRRDVPLLNR